ncbi:MAG: hypothetical protein R3B06_20745 [Kofleriaceae bacterium]
MIVRRAALVLVFAAACGGDGPGVTSPDAAVSSDATAGDATAGDCYQEADDLGNQTTPEATGLGFGVSPVMICGSIAVGHPGPSELDVDRYQLTVTTADTALVRLTAPAAAGLDRVEVIVTTSEGVTTRARVLGGLGAAVLALPIGAHTLTVSAVGSAAGDVPYRLTVVSDDPALRCPLAGTGVDYREADEGAAGHRANDMVAVVNRPQLTTSATADPDDRPEPTMRAVSAGGQTVLSGTSADVEPAGDDYHDRDTFAVYTGQTTNQLELRAGWGGPADLDVLVFEAEHADDPLGAPIPSITGELLVTAVKPSTLYWVWIGGSSRSTTLPADYRLAVCGREVTAAP